MDPQILVTLATVAGMSSIVVVVAKVLNATVEALGSKRMPLVVLGLGLLLAIIYGQAFPMKDTAWLPNFCISILFGLNVAVSAMGAYDIAGKPILNAAKLPEK
jgi:4-hydroxybenzoate polyprenyltransferase